MVKNIKLEWKQEDYDGNIRTLSKVFSSENELRDFWKQLSISANYIGKYLKKIAEYEVVMINGIEHEILVLQSPK